MGTDKNAVKEHVLEGKADHLIAISAAAAANCIPCFEYLYEKAVTSGISAEEIKRATDIAGQVKKGAHIAISNSIDELIGSKECRSLPCKQAAPQSCCE